MGLVSENATEANATVAERIFIGRTLWPKLVRIGQKITQELLPFWPGDYVAEFEDIRPTDARARLEEIRVSYPVLSINEIRERYYRLPAVEWGALPVGADNQASDAVGAQGPAPLQQTTDEETNSQPKDAVKIALDELGRWERFALKRLGRASGRAFEVRDMPDELAFEVAAGLLAAESAEEVRQVFKSAREVATALVIE